MAVLACVAYGVRQNHQNFYEFLFENSPHRVCTVCFGSDTLHTVDPAVVAQHDVNIAKAHAIDSRIALLEEQIRDLTLAREAQKTQKSLLTVARHEEDPTTAHDVQLQLTQLEADIYNVDRQLTVAKRTLWSQRFLLSAIQATVQQEAALRTQAHHQAIRHSMKITMPYAIRLILPQANRRLEAFLMALQPRLGQDAHASILTTELGDMIGQHLMLPRTSRCQEQANCTMISDTFARI